MVKRGGKRVSMSSFSINSLVKLMNHSLGLLEAGEVETSGISVRRNE